MFAEKTLTSQTSYIFLVECPSGLSWPLTFRTYLEPNYQVPLSVAPYQAESDIVACPSPSGFIVRANGVSAVDVTAGVFHSENGHFKVDFDNMLSVGIVIVNEAANMVASRSQPGISAVRLSPSGQLSIIKVFGNYPALSSSLIF